MLVLPILVGGRYHSSSRACLMVYTVGSHYEYSNSTCRLESTVAIISGITKLPSVPNQSILNNYCTRSHQAEACNHVLERRS